jgi:hypothetical protein
MSKDIHKIEALHVYHGQIMLKIMFVSSFFLIHLCLPMFIITFAAN